MGLLDLLADGAVDSFSIRFLPESSEVRSLAALWSHSAEWADWLSQRTGIGDTVGIVMSTEWSCLGALIGAWRSGLRVASLPGVARNESGAAYRHRLGAALDLLGAQRLLATGSVAKHLETEPVPVVRFDSSLVAPPGRREEVGSFVQFTSGSSGRPKGVELSLEAVGANVASILDRLDPQPGEVLVSWLPLSHDMGLIGTFLASWCAAAPTRAGSGEAVLIPTESFIKNPRIWLEACSKFRATFTASPNYGLELGARMLRRPRDVDLSSLRVLTCGAELVRPATLRAFEAAAQPVGLKPNVISPAYGLAEATLAVTMVSPATRWCSRIVDLDRTDFDDALDHDYTTGRELVSCGLPVRDMDVSTGSDGRISISGPSIATGYLGAGSRPFSGQFVTEDIGWLDPTGELYVTGRIDDVIVVAGVNLLAGELEDVAMDIDLRLRERCAAIAHPSGGYRIIVERPAKMGDPAELAGRIRSALADRFASPTEIVFIARGQLPRTTSGKVRRAHLAAGLESGAIDIIASVGPGGGR